VLITCKQTRKESDDQGLLGLELPRQSIHVVSERNANSTPLVHASASTQQHSISHLVHTAVFKCRCWSSLQLLRGGSLTPRTRIPNLRVCSPPRVKAGRQNGRTRVCGMDLYAQSRILCHNDFWRRTTWMYGQRLDQTILIVEPMQMDLRYSEFPDMARASKTTARVRPKLSLIFSVSLSVYLLCYDGHGMVDVRVHRRLSANIPGNLATANPERLAGMYWSGVGTK
jgi:hypothetical protein